MKKLLMLSLTAAVLLIYCGSALAWMMENDERHYHDLDQAGVIQPDYVKPDKGMCPDNTVFTTPYEGGMWCRTCPEGYQYSEGGKICGKCPPGMKLVPPYHHVKRPWSLGGLCVDYDK